MGNMHIVTGYKGQNHVTAADAGSLNAAIFGSGQYVLDRGNKFSITVVSNTSIRISTGDLILHGRHIRLTQDVTLTISNGTQSSKRNDLVVCRYTKNASSGVEDAEIIVIKGTATTGTPSDPTYTVGNLLDGTYTKVDMPLYRIPIVGINVETPVQLFVMASSHLAFEDNSIDTGKIVDSAVTSAKIGSSAVTTAKINNSAVTEAKIASNAVTEAKIKDNAVTSVKIANGAVTADKIQDGTISKHFEITTGTNWNLNSNGYYQQTVSCDGMLATYRPFADVDVSSAASVSAAEALIEDWSKVLRIDTEANAVTIYCTEAPSAIFTISMVVVVK